jgi:topoisomerase-4 subunit A
VVAEDLNYRSGDEFSASVRGRSNEALAFLDSTGRSYSVVPHTLPSARSQGEPLTGRLKPPDGATFVGVAMGSGKARLLLASSAGYGFVGRLEDMMTKNKAGKGLLNVPKGGVALRPFMFDSEGDGDVSDLYVAAATSSGHLLLFPISDLPEMSRGKGNKIINVPTAAFKAGTESVIAAVVYRPSQALVVYAGARHHRIKFRDLEHYIGERARRGRKLPRGFQKVDRIEVE